MKKLKHFWWELEIIQAIREYDEDGNKNPEHIFMTILRIIEEEKNGKKNNR